MSTKIFFLSMAIMPVLEVFGQSDSLNQYDAAGQKHGKWIVYLDKDWNKITDSTLACYSRYAVFIQGGNLYPMASWGKKDHTLQRNGTDLACKPGAGHMLDGEYKWYDDKRRIISTHILDKGMYTFYESYYSSGLVRSKWAYREQCGDIPEDYCIYVYDKKGNLTGKGTMPRDANGKPINKE